MEKLEIKETSKEDKEQAIKKEVILSGDFEDYVSEPYRLFGVARKEKGIRLIGLLERYNLNFDEFKDQETAERVTRIDEMAKKINKNIELLEELNPSDERRREVEQEYFKNIRSIFPLIFKNKEDANLRATKVIKGLQNEEMKAEGLLENSFDSEWRE